jgi:hypothetical protein
VEVCDVHGLSTATFYKAKAKCGGLEVSDAAIRGHVVVSFLALTLAKELTRLCQEKGLQPEWQPLLDDLDRLQEATIEKDGKVITTRTHVSGQVGNVFKATGIELPAKISELSPQT